MRKLSNPSFLTIGLLTALSFGTCSPSRAAGPVLSIASPSELYLIDPAAGYIDAGGAVLIQAVYEGLTEYDSDLHIVPALATSWEISADGMTYTFHLRENVAFHDGTPFNSAAVKANWERMAKRGKGPAYMAKGIAKIETPDDHTVIAHLKHPDSQFLGYQASLWGLKMVSPHAFTTHNDDWFSTHAVGTGPYVLESVNVGQEYLMSRNKNYWGKVADKGPDQISLRVIPSLETQQLLLTNGKLNMITHALPFNQLSALEKNPKVKVERFLSPKCYDIFMNTRNGPLTDIRIRRALSHAIDRNAFVQGILRGFGKVPTNTYPDQMVPGGAPMADFDREKARKMLADAGVKNLKLTYSYATSRPIWGTIGEALKSELAKVGVTVDLRPMTGGAFYSQVGAPDKAADLMGMDLMGDTAAPESFAYIVWHSNAALNFSALSDPELDKALDAVGGKVNEAKRAELYQEIDRRVEEDAPALFIAWPNEIIASNGVASYGYIPIIPWAPDPKNIVMSR